MVRGEYRDNETGAGGVSEGSEYKRPNLCPVLNRGSSPILFRFRKG
jgi:hypothetical protein